MDLVTNQRLQITLTSRFDGRPVVAVTSYGRSCSASESISSLALVQHDRTSRSQRRVLCCSLHFWTRVTVSIYTIRYNYECTVDQELTYDQNRLHTFPRNFLVNGEVVNLLRTCCSLVKPCPHCRRKVRLSQKSESVAENGDCRRKRRENGDKRTFLRQCGQGFSDTANKSATSPQQVVVMEFGKRHDTTHTTDF